MSDNKFGYGLISLILMNLMAKFKTW